VLRRTVSAQAVILSLMDQLRGACATLAARARHVRILSEQIPAYAEEIRRELEVRQSKAGQAREVPAADPADREATASFWLTLDAINFGSGWFPTLRKRPGLSGYNTIAAAWRDHLATAGPWRDQDLVGLDAGSLAAILGQDPGHPLMALYAASLSDLGGVVRQSAGGSFAAVADQANGSAVTLATMLGGWSCFEDCSRYEELILPFLKRAQIAAADLHRAGVTRLGDLDRLTMFADNLVPHVLRLDGVLRFEADLVVRIERGELIEHGSTEEVEIRAGALHAVESIVAQLASSSVTAVAVDEFLWNRGQQPRYKAVPRHRSRCTAY
jgi:hypothetical protein